MHLRTIASFSDELLKIASKELKMRIPTNKEDFQKVYSKGREPTAAGIRGGLAGFFLSRVASGKLPGAAATRAMSALGAGVGVADHYAQAKKKSKTAMLAASSTFTPGRALTQGRATGSFHSKIKHRGDISRDPVVNNVATPVPG